MRFTHRTRHHIMSACLALVLTASAIAVATPAAAQVRGFDGTTINIAGYGIKQLLPGTEFGARARVEQFNDDAEIKGIKLNFIEFADDKQDPATALSEVRRLVTQDQVFALVPDVSLASPGDYITQQQVPTFGGGFSPGFCSTKVTTKIWLFGFNGCQVTDTPTIARDTEANVLTYVRKQTGKQHPTAAAIAEETAHGGVVVKLFAAQFKGGGWGKTVYAEGSLPAPPVGDVSPYVQKILTADNGKPPDFVRCAAGTTCLQIYSALRAAGYQGEFESDLYSDVLVKPLAGSLANASYHNPNETGNPVVDRIKAEVEAVKPGQKLDSGVLFGYLTTDMFISALKKAAKHGKSGITPQNVQKAASTNTWVIKGFAGGTEYPAASVSTVPVCKEILKSDGTTWQTVEPFSCNRKGYKLK